MRLVFDQNAFDDLAWWMNTDQKTARRIVSLIQEISKMPFVGRGKPEPLKHDLSGFWSRRIDDANRLVYAVTNDEIRIIACRFHYS